LELPAQLTTKHLFRIKGSDGPSNICQIHLVNSGSGVKVQVLASGGTSVATVDTMTEGSTYHLWWKHVPGSGSDAECHVAFSTTTSMPTDGQNGYAKRTNGTSTLTADTLQIAPEYSSDGQCMDISIDNVFITSSTLTGVFLADLDLSTASLSFTGEETKSVTVTNNGDRATTPTTSLTTGSTTHSQTVSNACGASYTYYVRCQDGSGNPTPTSTAISYSVATAGTTLYLPWRVATP